MAGNYQQPKFKIIWPGSTINMMQLSPQMEDGSPHSQTTIDPSYVTIDSVTDWLTQLSDENRATRYGWTEMKMIWDGSLANLNQLNSLDFQELLVR